MITETIMDSVLHAVSRKLELWRDLFESRSELARLGTDDIELLAADCGLSPGQFRDMLKRGSHAADELAEVMEALDIVEAVMKSGNTAPLNDMKRVCAQCVSKTACRKSIRRGTVAADYQDYCPNAEMLRGVRRGRLRLVA